MATVPSTPQILNLAELAALRARVAELEARNEVLAAQLTARDAQLEAAQARLAVLTDQIEELRRRLGRDSSTLSKPPSSDSPHAKKPRDRSLRRRSGRRPGKPPQPNPGTLRDSVGDMAIMTRPLGGTGADVTILGYGAMELRGRPRGPEIADEDAGRLLNTVLDSGINLIDTSPDYGRSEELMGIYIGNRRDEFFLASKCGCPIEFPADAPPPYPHDYSPGNVRADVEQSLRRLRTDHLDLVQVHMSPSKATLEENHTVETLKDLQAEGKVRFIGMSGILPNLPDHVAMGVFDVFQIPYSAVQRDHEELITEAADAGAGTFIRGGAARGAASEDKNWQTGPLSQGPGLGRRNWETSGIADLLSEAGMSNMEFVLRFTLSHPGLSTTIVGTSNPVHLASNIAVAQRGPLPADVYEEAKKRLPLPEAR